MTSAKLIARYLALLFVVELAQARPATHSVATEDQVELEERDLFHTVSIKLPERPEHVSTAAPTPKFVRVSIKRKKPEWIDHLPDGYIYHPDRGGQATWSSSEGDSASSTDTSHLTARQPADPKIFHELTADIPSANDGNGHQAISMTTSLTSSSPAPAITQKPNINMVPIWRNRPILHGQPNVHNSNPVPGRPRPYHKLVTRDTHTLVTRDAHTLVTRDAHTLVTRGATPMQAAQVSSQTLSPVQAQKLSEAQELPKRGIMTIDAHPYPPAENRLRLVPTRLDGRTKRIKTWRGRHRGTFAPIIEERGESLEITSVYDSVAAATRTAVVSHHGPTNGAAAVNTMSYETVTATSTSPVDGDWEVVDENLGVLLGSGLERRDEGMWSVLQAEKNYENAGDIETKLQEHRESRDAYEEAEEEYDLEANYDSGFNALAQFPDLFHVESPSDFADVETTASQSALSSSTTTLPSPTRSILTSTTTISGGTKTVTASPAPPTETTFITKILQSAGEKLVPGDCWAWMAAGLGFLAFLFIGWA